jgi:hypothetical protein
MGPEGPEGPEGPQGPIGPEGPAGSYVPGPGIGITGDVISAIDISYTNEFQQLAINGDSLFITNGNYILLPSSQGPWQFNGPDIYYNVGNVGINKFNPAERFHMYGGNAKFEWFSGSVTLTTPGSWPGFVSYIQNGNRRDIAFRDFGISLTASSSSASPGLTEGIWIREGGNVGIRTYSPGNYPLMVAEHSVYGIGIHHQSSNNTWELYTSSGGTLDLYRDGSFRGSFHGTTGVYTPTSPFQIKSLKQKAKPLANNWDKMAALVPLTSEGNTGEILIGLDLKEVQKLFPELVYEVLNEKTGELEYTLDYNGLLIVMLKAVQEQQEALVDQATRIQELEIKFESLLQDLKQ